MQIMIFDDDIEFSILLSSSFKSYFSNLIDSFDIKTITKDFSLETIKEAYVVFIDIDLNGTDGIALAKYIKSVSPRTLIIFVSAKDELVFNALSVTTFQFIRKSKFNEDYIRVFKQLHQYILENEKSIIIDVKGRQHTIKTHEIQFILSFGRELLIQTYKHEYILISTIKEILDLLTANTYNDIVQISRSVAVNLNHISSIDKNNIILHDSTSHTIGRVYKANFINTYEEFILR